MSGPSSTLSSPGDDLPNHLIHDLCKKVACSRVETIVISPTTGDVLVSRSREDAIAFIPGNDPSLTTAAAAAAAAAAPSAVAGGGVASAGSSDMSMSSSFGGYGGYHRDGSVGTMSVASGGPATLCYQCQQWSAELAEGHCRYYGPCGADGGTTGTPPLPCGGGGPCGVGVSDDDAYDAARRAGQGLLGGAGGRLGAAEEQDQPQPIGSYGPSPYSWGIRRSSEHSDDVVGTNHRQNTGGRLLGGGPEGQNGHYHKPPPNANGATSATTTTRMNGPSTNGRHTVAAAAQEKTAPLTLHPSLDESVDDGSVDDINLLPSFDYSHFVDGGNDMITNDNDGVSRDGGGRRSASASPQRRMQPVHEEQKAETSWASLVSGGGAAAAAAAAASSPSRRTSARAASSPGSCTDISACDTLDLSVCGGGIKKTSSMDEYERSRRAEMMAASSASPQPVSEAPDPPVLMHGVPTFFSALSQIFVTKVSAHPLGSHVLLISREALLFSYGKNQHGQLGHGTQEQGFVLHPTIVTPLLENGGKTIDCAAGMDHSLVVVQTVGERVGHLLSDGSSSSTVHHQVYGFGRNDYMKLGLNDPSSSPSAASPTKKRSGKTGNAKDGDGLEDDVLLPRSVRLGVTFAPCPREGREEKFSQRGVFSLAASIHHSAALVRTDSDLIELYTWGKADRGELGLGSHVREVVGLDRRNEAGRKMRIVKPTLKRRLSALPRAVAIPNIVESLSNRSVGGRKAFPCSVSLGPECTSVILSDGKLITFGTSTDGLLGLGSDVKTMLEPSEVTFGGAASSHQITSMSYGARHAVALADDGSTFAWGLSDHGRIGAKPQGQDAVNTHRSKSSKKKRIVSSPRTIHFSSKLGSADKHSIASACAGLDNTVFVTKSGEILSCGRVSGRLGQGEVMNDVHMPTPMFGGLRMWYH